MSVVRASGRLGWKARRVERSLIVNGRLRGMRLVQDQFERNTLTTTNWIGPFTEKYGGAHLEPHDLCLSLAWGDPDDGWPETNLAKSWAHIASFMSAEPDDVQLARELVGSEIAQQVLREWAEASPIERRQWQIDEDRFWSLREGM